jgi:hypothetical protein
MAVAAGRSPDILQIKTFGKSACPFEGSGITDKRIPFSAVRAESAGSDPEKK